MNEPISFNDKSRSKSLIKSWSWDFSNGSISDEENPVYTFTTAGTYSVSLTITDMNGLSATISKEIEIFGMPSFNPTLSNTILLVGKIESNIQANANLQSNSGNSTVTWTLPDDLGTFSNGTNSITANSPIINLNPNLQEGEYIVTATLTSASGTVNKQELIVKVISNSTTKVDEVTYPLENSTSETSTMQITVSKDGNSTKDSIIITSLLTGETTKFEASDLNEIEVNRGDSLLIKFISQIGNNTVTSKDTVIVTPPKPEGVLQVEQPGEGWNEKAVKINDISQSATLISGTISYLNNTSGTPIDFENNFEGNFCLAIMLLHSILKINIPLRF